MNNKVNKDSGKDEENCGEKEGSAAKFLGVMETQLMLNKIHIFFKPNLSAEKFLCSFDKWENIWHSLVK